jgi:hypothetical protein
MPLDHWKRLLLFIFLFMSMPLLTGCFLDVKRLVEIAGDNRELLPVRSFRITMDPRQREQLFKQFHKFAEKHGYEIVISDYGTNFESYMVEIFRDNIEISATHSGHDRDIVSVWLYDQSRAKPTSEETMETINELAADLESFITEIPDVTITDRR